MRACTGDPVLKGTGTVKRLIRKVIASALVVGSVFAAAPAASAATVVKRSLVNRNSGLDLAIPHGDRIAGLQAIQWWESGTDEQRWFYREDLDWVQFRNAATNMCLTVGAAEGAPVVQRPCDNLKHEQFWSRPDVSGGPDTIVNYSTHMCLAIGGGSPDAGAGAIQWRCTGNKEQQWDNGLA